MVATPTEAKTNGPVTEENFMTYTRQAWRKLFNGFLKRKDGILGISRALLEDNQVAIILGIAKDTIQQVREANSMVIGLPLEGKWSFTVVPVEELGNRSELHLLVKQYKDQFRAVKLAMAKGIGTDNLTIMNKITYLTEIFGCFPEGTQQGLLNKNFNPQYLNVPELIDP